MQSLRLYLFSRIFRASVEAKMHSLNIVHRSLRNTTLSRDLADLLFDRVLYDKIVVVTNKPRTLHSTVKKRWQYLIRHLQIERARRLSKDSIKDISSKISLMQTVTFSSQLPADYMLDANITFLNADDCTRIAPVCQTLCVTYDFPKENLYLMTGWMPKGGSVVIYGQN